MAIEDVSKFDLASAALLNRPDVQVLSAQEERSLLVELDACKRLLLESSPRPCTEPPASGGGEPEEPEDGQGDAEIQVLVRDLLRPAATATEQGRRLAAVASRYNTLRSRLAMANLRLVAHVAKKYRDRGIAPADLLQEGFCGLLKAIDRFEASRETRLASYAVWWIRQALQRAVAAGAYPVRLNPRHLQQLAQGNDEERGARPGGKPRSWGAANTLRQIHAATRPALSLNANPRADERGSLLSALTYPPHDEAPSAELDECLGVMMRELKPREQVVLQLRFGLGGQACHSLSEVSQVLDVSKERIRQIQEGALQKLRDLARDQVYCEAAV